MISKQWLVVLPFILGAALSWGLYVPSVHEAADSLKSNMRAFLFVGVAYFITAVVFPLLLIFVFGDPTEKPGANWGLKGTGWGILAGTLGAVGALCVIYAVTAAKAEGIPKGPLYVAPLVFAGAPIINTIATITIFSWIHKSTGATPTDPRFYLGLVLAAAGAAMVMIYKPKDGPKPVQPVPVAESTDQADASGTSITASSGDESS
ncbi:hypothetical protein [Stratiformator vulcanicus]|uniref:Uncharacterized protein n=1 Tax=Stratiformator vulcanicus TaxID=2527980 RepID=A0A517R0P7_9PLAN|nr:hypothetical protein [Stratiformator vulcanicus]QDT37441.1 hypothetical protein Pan189_18210 [Stratiformator vulcanicus]